MEHEKKPLEEEEAEEVVDIRVYNAADRQVIAGILVMNGYTVSQVKVPKNKGKSNYYCLRARIEKENLESQ